MRTFRTVSGIAVGALFALPAFAAPQQERPNQQPPARPAAQQEERTAEAGSKAKERLRCACSSKLIGATVQTPAGKDLGTLNDIVIDPSTGRIAYGVLSFGGWMGVGDKLFAIPWNAFEPRYKDGERQLTLDVAKQQLEQAQGFPQDNWPDMANRRWATSTHEAHGQQPYWSAQSRGGALETVRVSQLAGQSLLDQQAESLGTIQSLAIDADNARVTGAVLKHGATLGMGGEKYLIPWDKITVSEPQEGEYKLVTDLKRQQFESAPKLTQGDEFENDADHVMTVYRFYQVRPYWVAVADQP